MQIHPRKFSVICTSSIIAMICAAPVSITTPLKNLLSRAPTPRVFTKYSLNQPTYAHSNTSVLENNPLNGVKIVLDPPSRPSNISPALSKRPPPIRIYYKIVGISKKGENHSIHSFSCLIYWGFECFYFHLTGWKHNNPEGRFCHRRVGI